MSRMSFAKPAALVLFPGFFSLQFSALAQTVSSPNGRLLLTFEAAPNGATPPASPLSYQLSFRGKPLIERSALRMEFEGRRVRCRRSSAGLDSQPRRRHLSP